MCTDVHLHLMKRERAIKMQLRLCYHTPPPPVPIIIKIINKDELLNCYLNKIKQLFLSLSDVATEPEGHNVAMLYFQLAGIWLCIF